MILRYEITLDDWIAFNHFHHEHSRAFKSQRRMIRFGCAGVLMLLALIILIGDIARGVVSLAPIPFVLLALTILIFANRCLLQSISKQASRMYSEGSGRGMFGPHEFEVVPDGIVTRDHYREEKIYWRGIDKIEETPRHVFIYIGSVQAIIIPRRNVNSGELESLLRMIRAELGKAPPSAPPPTSRPLQAHS